MNLLVLTILGSDQSENGMSKKELVQRLLSKMEVSIRGLLQTGEIHTTVDDQHLKVTSFPDDGLDAVLADLVDLARANHVDEGIVDKSFDVDELMEN